MGIEEFLLDRAEKKVRCKAKKKESMCNCFYKGGNFRQLGFLPAKLDPEYRPFIDHATDADLPA
jgi:hypothetical protein